MEWLIGGAIIIAIVWMARRKKVETWQAPPRADPPSRVAETVPDNPRFATWEDALNRRVDGDERFLIEYADADGIVTEREIRPRMLRLTPNRSEIEIEAWCALRQDIRNFRSDRMLAAKNMRTGRAIADLGIYLRSRY